MGVDDAAMEAREKTEPWTLSANPYFCKRLLSKGDPKTGLWQCRGFEGADYKRGGPEVHLQLLSERRLPDACPVAGIAYIAFDFNDQRKIHGAESSMGAHRSQIA